MQLKLLVCALLFCRLLRVSALPSGAPSRACNTFMPRHVDRMNGGLISAQNTADSPYRIMMSRTNFTRNTIIRVWVMDSRTSGQTGYRGILLQARQNNGFDRGPQGSWQATPRFTKLMTCSGRNDAVTHSEVDNIKDDMTVFEWKAPCDADVGGDIVFTATIAETRQMFWPRVTSAVVAEMSTAGSGDEEMEEPECDAASGVRVAALSWTLATMLAVIIIL